MSLGVIVLGVGFGVACRGVILTDRALTIAGLICMLSGSLYLINLQRDECSQVASEQQYRCN